MRTLSKGSRFENNCGKSPFWFGKIMVHALSKRDDVAQIGCRFAARLVHATIDSKTRRLIHKGETGGRDALCTGVFIRLFTI